MYILLYGPNIFGDLLKDAAREVQLAVVCLAFCLSQNLLDMNKPFQITNTIAYFLGQYKEPIIIGGTSHPCFNCRRP